MVPNFPFYRRESWGLIRIAWQRPHRETKAKLVWEVRILDPQTLTLLQSSFPYVTLPHILVFCLMKMQWLFISGKKGHPSLGMHAPCGLWLAAHTCLFRILGPTVLKTSGIWAKIGHAEPQWGTYSQGLFPKTTWSQRRHRKGYMLQCLLLCLTDLVT